MTSGAVLLIIGLLLATLTIWMAIYFKRYPLKGISEDKTLTKQPETSDRENASTGVTAVTEEYMPTEIVQPSDYDDINKGNS